MQPGMQVFINGFRVDDISLGVPPGSASQPIAVDAFGNQYVVLSALSPGAGTMANIELVSTINSAIEAGQEGLPAVTFSYLFGGIGGATENFYRQLAVTPFDMDPTPGNMQTGVALTTGPAEWSLPHTPAVATRATVTRAAVANARHVCKGIFAQLSVAAADVGVAGVLVNLRNGASGAGTILWSGRLCVVAGGGNDKFEATGLNIAGSVNTAMTLEFAAAPGAASFEAVTLTGYTTPALA